MHRRGTRSVVVTRACFTAGSTFFVALSTDPDGDDDGDDDGARVGGGDGDLDGGGGDGGGGDGGTRFVVPGFWTVSGGPYAIAGVAEAAPVPVAAAAAAAAAASVLL